MTLETSLKSDRNILCRYFRCKIRKQLLLFLRDASIDIFPFIVLVLRVDNFSPKTIEKNKPEKQKNLRCAKMASH